MILAVLVGICVGIVDTIFGRGLLTISDFREQYYRYLLPILPVAGLAIVWMYQRFSSLSLKGMTLVFEVGQKKREEIPLALVPLVMIGTWITHLSAAVPDGKGWRCRLVRRSRMRRADGSISKKQNR